MPCSACKPCSAPDVATSSASSRLRQVVAERSRSAAPARRRGRRPGARLQVLAAAACAGSRRRPHHLRRSRTSSAKAVDVPLQRSVRFAWRTNRSRSAAPCRRAAIARDRVHAPRAAQGVATRSSSPKRPTVSGDLLARLPSNRRPAASRSPCWSRLGRRKEKATTTRRSSGVSGSRAVRRRVCSLPLRGEPRRLHSRPSCRGCCGWNVSTALSRAATTIAASSRQSLARARSARCASRAGRRAAARLDPLAVRSSPVPLRRRRVARRRADPVGARSSRLHPPRRASAAESVRAEPRTAALSSALIGQPRRHSGCRCSAWPGSRATPAASSRSPPASLAAAAVVGRSSAGSGASGAGVLAARFVAPGLRRWLAAEGLRRTSAWAARSSLGAPSSSSRTSVPPRRLASSPALSPAIRLGQLRAPPPGRTRTAATPRRLACCSRSPPPPSACSVPPLAASAALFAAAAFAARGRTLVSSAFGLAAPPEFRRGAMALRAASMQFGYFTGSLAAGAALAGGGYAALGATAGILFLRQRWCSGARAAHGDPGLTGTVPSLDEPATAS